MSKRMNEDGICGMARGSSKRKGNRDKKSEPGDDSDKSGWIKKKCTSLRDGKEGKGDYFA